MQAEQHHKMDERGFLISLSSVSDGWMWILRQWVGLLGWFECVDARCETPSVVLAPHDITCCPLVAEMIMKETKEEVSEEGSVIEQNTGPQQERLSEANLYQKLITANMMMKYF